MAWTTTRRPVDLPGHGGPGQRYTFPSSNSATRVRSPRLNRAAARADRIAVMPAALLARSQGRCELQLGGCSGSGQDVHRRTRARGHKDRLSNQLNSCGACSACCERDLKGARRLGLIIAARQDPADVPVLYRGEMALLDDDGAVTPQPGAKVRRGIPIGSLLYRQRNQLKPWWMAGTIALTAVIADSVNIPPMLAALAVPLEAAAVWWMAPKILKGGKKKTVGSDGSERELELAEHTDATLARRRRAAVWTSIATGLWMTQALLAGVAPTDAASKLLWTEAALLFGASAVPYWRYVRPRPRKKPEPAPEPVLTELDKLQKLALWHWENKIARDGGRGAGATLENIHKVMGGWGATIVVDDASGFDLDSQALHRAIAQAYKVGMSAVTLEPDPDDAGRALLLVQKVNPLREKVPWRGPRSIDIANGTAHAGRYIDGSDVPYEIVRPGWGSPHVGLFGTTGSGKSEFINQLFVIDRWFYDRMPDGTPFGMVADILIDPQGGQSFGAFADDLALPIIDDLEVAIMVIEAFNDEMLRRNRYLANAPWFDGVGTANNGLGRARKGRKWWDPRVDGPIVAVTIDEAHMYLQDPRFCAAVTRGARMWRKCGGQIRIATHTPLLDDLGGDMALRDMLTGGFVAVFRTRTALTGQTAFAGSLPVDPRQIPGDAGMCYVMARNPRPMLARAAWEEDYYNYIRDEHDRPIGYPGQLPQITLDTLGADVNDWAAARRRGELWVPRTAVANTGVPNITDLDDYADAKMTGDVAKRKLLDAIRALRGQGKPAQFNELVDQAGLRTRTASKYLRELVDERVVVSEAGPGASSGFYRIVNEEVGANAG